MSQSRSQQVGSYSLPIRPVQLSNSNDEEVESIAPSKQWFATETEAAPVAPDMLRLLITMGRNDIPLVSENDLQIIDSCADESTELGTGAFGQVRMANWTSADRPPVMVAVKQYKALQPLIFDSSEPAVNRARVLYDLQFEVEIMSRCKHENIAALLAISFHEVEDGNEVHSTVAPMLLLEPALAATPDLSRYMAKCSVNIDEAISLLVGIARGITALHSLGVVHADLKPDNILIFKQNSKVIPKLSDFGLSGISTSRDSPRGGTPRWNAPECLRNAPASLAGFSTETYRDVYAFGLIIGFVLSGREPFAPDAIDIDELKLDKKDIMPDHVWSQLPIAVQTSKYEDNIRAALRATLRLWPGRRCFSLKEVEVLLDPVDSRGSTWFSQRALNRTSLQLSDFRPFGTAKIGEQLPNTELINFGAIKDFRKLLEDSNSLPRSLREMMATQLEDNIRRNPDLSKISLTWKICARSFIPEDRLQKLYKDRRDFEQFTVSYDQDAIDAMRTDASFIGNVPTVGGGSLMKEIFLNVTKDHLAYVAFISARDNMNAILAHGPALNWQVANGISSDLTPLHIHAASGPKATKEIAERFSINYASQPYLWTPLHSAALGRSAKAVMTLLELGADPNSKLGGASKWTLTPLMTAIYADNSKAVEVLLGNKNTNLWARDSGYLAFTAAHYAAEINEKGKILSMLIKKDPGLIEAKDEKGRTPLQRAALNGRLNNVKVLVKAGAKINSLDEGHSVPLHRAYAFANGLQGLQQIFSDSTRSGKIIIIHEYCVPQQVITSFNSLLGERSQNDQFNVLNMAPESLAGYKNIDGETPYGHEAFKLFRRSQSSIMAAQIYDSMLALFDELQQSQPHKPLSALLPHFNIDRENELFELNITKLVDLSTRRKEQRSHIRAKGQEGETFLSNKVGRKIVAYLLKQGADPDALNKVGYTPECYAYRPQDLNWAMRLPFVSRVSYEPAGCWHVGNSLLGEADNNLSEEPTLYLHPLQGSFSLWSWIQHVIPSPSDAILLVSMRRFATESSQSLDSVNLIVEAQMHPPNDSRHKTQTLFHKSYKLVDLLPSSDQDYVVRLADIPLKHKCNLVINIRSSSPLASVIPGMAFYQLDLRSRLSFKPAELARVLKPLGSSTISRHPSMASILAQPPAKMPLPRFPPGTFWHKAPAVKKSTAEVRLRKHMADSVKIMSLKTPNPTVYTRPVLAFDELGNTVYGEKTWHYRETEDVPSRRAMRWMSDGMDMRSAFELEMSLEGEI